MMIIAISVGSGVGINSLIARRLGAKNQEAADKAASTSIRIGLFNYLIFFVIGVFFAKPFISGYAEEGTFIFESACQYLQIVCIGSLFLNIQVVLEKVLQSTGNMVAPMKCSLTGAIVNVILDPILIFGLFGMPQMGVAGAALATIIGQMCGMIMGVSIVLRGEHLVNIKIRGFKMDWKIVADIYKVGLPSIVMQSIASVMIIFYNMILVAYSTTAVAVLGVYFRIQSFVFMPVFGLNQGAMPILGYNYGAKNKDRLMKTYKEAFKVALIVMAAGTLLFQAIPAQLLLIFDASEEMLRIGVPALRLISLCFIPAAFGIITGTLFQGTGHGVLSLYASVIRQLVGILPLAYLLIKIGGVTLSWLAFPLAEILGLIYSAIMLRWLYKKEISKL
jgi:putative MATE family efflux protein